MYGVSDDFANHGFGTAAVGHTGEVCQQKYFTVTEHGCTRSPPHRLLPSPTPQAWVDSTIVNPGPAPPPPPPNPGQLPVTVSVVEGVDGVSLVTGIFSFGNMGGNMRMMLMYWEEMYMRYRKTLKL
jgi:hypothetical protein